MNSRKVPKKICLYFGKDENDSYIAVPNSSTVILGAKGSGKTAMIRSIITRSMQEYDFTLVDFIVFAEENIMPVGRVSEGRSIPNLTVMPFDKVLDYFNEIEFEIDNRLRSDTIKKHTCVIIDDGFDDYYDSLSLLEKEELIRIIGRIKDVSLSAYVEIIIASNNEDFYSSFMDGFATKVVMKDVNDEYFDILDKYFLKEFVSISSAHEKARVLLQYKDKPILRLFPRFYSDCWTAKFLRYISINNKSLE